MSDASEIIDTKMHGYPGVTAAFLLRGEKTALVETGPKTTVRNVLGALQAAGVDALDAIVVTHIHLDHAGAAGTLAARFPDATVFVHEVGAPHLVDPTKLWSSASRIYGDQMETLWGGIDPIPQERVRVLHDGDKVDLGGRSLQAIETPGHAYHHHAYLDDATGAVYTGDAIGVRLQGIDLVRPATPPPEFHLEKAIASIERIRSVGAESLCLTHFGPTEASVEATCDSAIESLNAWAEWVRRGRDQATELDDVAAEVRRQAVAAFEERLAPTEIEKLEQTTSYRMNTMGYMRYLDKNERD
ncbi:MAG: MBL fold metallo-hydrolase [Actinobacteria bacterium]|nr:MBL fold metallo-hydrolase [Actinomycetota bacterium]